MRNRLLFCFVALLPAVLFAQQPDSLTAVQLQEFKPVFLPIPQQTVFPGDELVVPLNAYNHKGSKILFQYTWALGGRIDQDRKEFRWVPSEKDIGIHPIIFTAIDSLTRQQVSQPAIIIVKERQYPPELKLKANVNLETAFVTIDEGQDFAVVVQAMDRNEDDQLQLGYYVNGDSTRTLSNARFERKEGVATFLWTPNDQQAQEKSFTFTFYAEDRTGLRTEKSVPVFVRDILHVPVFEITNPEYYVNEGETLTFTVKARDEDQEPLSYKVITSDIKISDFFFDSKTGKFQWKPTFDYANQKREYQLVISASDRQHTIYDTIKIKVDPINYPPEIEPIADRKIREDEELIIQLNVKDKNGDENLTVEVAQADFEGYSFDPAKREFRWKPPFTFVNGEPKRDVMVTFRASDSESEDLKTVTITVYDRDDPKEILRSYRLTLQSARQIAREIGRMESNVKATLDHKRHWNTIFDVATIVVGAFTSVASSPIASETLKKSAVPIAGAATTLIGIRRVIDKSSDKVSSLLNRLIILHGNVDVTINSMIRDYGEEPGLTTTDSAEFKKALTEFKRNLQNIETLKEKLEAEYAQLDIKESRH